jgi:hypothetical protein
VLAERNLGLAPIAEPASFAWPGQWLAIVEGPDAAHAVVMFGSPSDVWLDPAGAYRECGTIVAGWMLAPLDVHLPTTTPYGAGAGVERRLRSSSRRRQRRRCTESTLQNGSAVGPVECVGRRLAEPCAHLEKLARPNLLRPLLHRGGLRADVLSVGDEIS